MDSVFTVIGIIKVIAGVAIALVKKTEARKSKTIGTVLAVIGILTVLIGNSVSIIPTGYTGVRTTLGQVEEKPLDSGVVFCAPFIQKIETICNKQQVVTVSTPVWGESSEKVPVYASEIEITYSVTSAKSAWIVANVKNTEELLTSSVVSSAIKAAMIQFPADTVTSRSVIEPMAKTELQKNTDERYGEDVIVIVKVTINDMDFEDSYNDAIAEKSIAMQAQQKQEIENATAIAKAEADKKVAITNAEAEAEAAKIKAEADAEVLKIEAEAEAAANKKLAESLTDEILRSKFYDVWDGKLPTVMGEGTVITSVDGYDASEK